jgi:glycosyltransferase involved in cell wall biosynthesis
VTGEPEYDVCLLLEGTYPFVVGGVSMWMHNLIKGLPEIEFTGVCILPSSKEKWEKKFELPKNFRDLKVVYLYDHEQDQKGKAKRRRRLQQIDVLRTFHRNLFERDYTSFQKILPIFQRPKKGGLTPYDMIYGKEAWQLLLSLYRPDENRESFIDYFWTYRLTHLPIFKILRTKIPRAKIYHTISTGYAGLLGTTAKHIYQSPFLLTEHGIYTKERKIEIAQADWIYVAGGEQVKIQKDLGAFQKIWISLFESLGRITYQEADKIYTLYEGNRQIEITEGADPKKTFVIPNGIDIERFSRLKPVDSEEDRDQTAPFNVGFVGRVVSIKDVKTFIRACKIVSLHLPNVKFYILGPKDDEPEYHRECVELVRLLRLQEHIEFTGKVDVMEYYPILDVMVLTSISEAQPIVILEANCAGIPMVASDVGACRELLEGRTREDKAIGPSGILTRVADPAGTAQGIISILSDKELRRNMSLSGRRRMESFYKESDLNRKYLSIYREFMDGKESN